MKDIKKETKLVPRLRFKEFPDQWVNTTLGKASKFSKGKNISKSHISEDGSTECIRYGELYTHYKELVDETISKTSLDNSELVLSELYDILIPASGETAIDISTASCLLKENIALGGDINIIKTSEYGPFLTYYLKHKKKYDIARVAQGNSVVHLYPHLLKSLMVHFPSITEQQKIVSFLTVVDKRIEQLTKKKKLLEEYKKGVMQKIFNQEIRFKDENGNDFPEWEEKRLGEIAKIYQPITISSADLIKDGYPVYGANGIIGKYHKYNHEKEQIAVTCRGNTCGTINWTEPKSWITGNSMVVNTDENNNIIKIFLYYQLNFTNLNYLITGSGQPQITSDLKTHKVLIPSIDEQGFISEFLLDLDKQTVENKQSITYSVKFKQGLLQQMFI